MSFDFRFNTVEKKIDLSDMLLYSRNLSLNYPKYDDWMQKVEYQVINGEKTAIVARLNGVVCGVLIYQPSKDIKGFLDLKQIRVSEFARGRHVGTFLLKQMEQEAKGKYSAIKVDARVEKHDVAGLFAANGYIPIAKIPIYESGEEDVVFVKPLLKDLASSKSDVLTLYRLN